MRPSVLLLIAGLSLRVTAGLDNGLARTPVLGYNTWNCFGGNSKCTRPGATGPRCLKVKMNRSSIAGVEGVYYWFAVNEELVKLTADLLISTKLQDAGYQYLVIDGEGPCCLRAVFLSSVHRTVRDRLLGSDGARP